MGAGIFPNLDDESLDLKRIYVTKSSVKTFTVSVLCLHDAYFKTNLCLIKLPHSKSEDRRTRGLIVAQQPIFASGPHGRLIRPLLPLNDSV